MHWTEFKFLVSLIFIAHLYIKVTRVELGQVIQATVR